jgi:uroporphyrinogen-III synthase
MNAEAYFSKNSLGKNQRVVAIGATTAGALRELGIMEIKIAGEATERGLAEAVLRLHG